MTEISQFECGYYIITIIIIVIVRNELFEQLNQNRLSQTNSLFVLFLLCFCFRFVVVIFFH